MPTVSAFLEAMVPAGSTGLASPDIRYCLPEGGEFGIDIPLALRLQDRETYGLPQNISLTLSNNFAQELDENNRMFLRLVSFRKLGNDSFSVAIRGDAGEDDEFGPKLSQYFYKFFAGESEDVVFPLLISVKRHDVSRGSVIACHFFDSHTCPVCDRKLSLQEMSGEGGKTKNEVYNCNGCGRTIEVVYRATRTKAI